MPNLGEAAFAFLIMLTAALYAAVGQAGASGYLALMGLWGFDPAVMKPTALSLNVLVAAVATLQFWRAGHFSWRTFYPFGILGFPFSLVGGAINLPAHAYYPVVGVLLLVAAAQLTRSAFRPLTAPREAAHPPFLPALLVGALIGLVSGVTGTGGGIFLAPIIAAMGWVEIRRMAAVTAAYNLLNSSAALIGAVATLKTLPAALPLWLALAGMGGLAGAAVGSRFLPEKATRLLLAGVLLIAGVKLVAA